MDISMLKTLKVVAVGKPTQQRVAQDIDATFPLLNAIGEDQLRSELRPSADALTQEVPVFVARGSALLVRDRIATELPQVERYTCRMRKNTLQPLEETERPAINSPARKKWLKLGIRIGMTVLLFALLGKSISWSSLLLLLGNVRHTLLLMGLAIGVCGIMISSYQWRSLLHGERIRFDLANLVNLYLVGIAFSHFLPTGMGGDAVKAIYVGREAGNTEGSTSAVVMSRITGFLGMLVIATVVLVVWHEHFSSTVVLSFIGLSLAVAGMIGGAIVAAVFLPRLLGRGWAGKLLQRVRWSQKVVDSVVRIGSALGVSARRPRALLSATLFGVIFWAIACLNYDSYAIALGINIPLYFYFVAIPLVSLVTFLPISINGFGVRESTFVYIFATMKVAPASALLLALVMDVQVIFFGVIGGCIYLMMGEKGKAHKSDAREGVRRV